jgi:hypothetical protein
VVEGWEVVAPLGWALGWCRDERVSTKHACVRGTSGQGWAQRGALGCTWPGVLHVDARAPDWLASKWCAWAGVDSELERGARCACARCWALVHE